MHQRATVFLLWCISSFFCQSPAAITYFFLTLLQFSFLGFLTCMTHFIFSSLFIALWILRTPRYKQGYEAGEQSKVLLTFCCVDVYLCQSSYSETTAARRLFFAPYLPNWFCRDWCDLRLLWAAPLKPNEHERTSGGGLKDWIFKVNENV